MSYTNVTIPSRWSTIVQMREKVKLLEFQLEQRSQQIDQLEREFSNIPEAIKKYGYVELSDHHGNFLMKIVEHKENARLSENASKENE